MLAERPAVEDDSMPCAYLSEFDQGLYGGLLGGEVRFLAHPGRGLDFLDGAAAAEATGRSSTGSASTSRIPGGSATCGNSTSSSSAAAGKWGISHFILIDALNFVFELIGGTQTYLSVEERPEIVRRAIDFAYDLNVRVQREFFEAVPLFDGGTLQQLRPVDPRPHRLRKPRSLST